MFVRIDDYRAHVAQLALDLFQKSLQLLLDFRRGPSQLQGAPYGLWARAALFRKDEFESVFWRDYAHRPAVTNDDDSSFPLKVVRYRVELCSRLDRDRSPYEILYLDIFYCCAVPPEIAARLAGALPWSGDYLAHVEYVLSVPRSTPFALITGRREML